MTDAMKSALEVLAAATERDLGTDPVSRSVSQLADRPSDADLKAAKSVFDRLPSEDRARVSLIAENEARKLAGKDAPKQKPQAKPDLSRQDISGVGAIDELLEDQVGDIAKGKHSLL